MHGDACVCVYSVKKADVMRTAMATHILKVPSEQTAVEQVRKKLGHTNKKSVKISLKSGLHLGAIWELKRAADSHPLKCSLSPSRQLDLRLSWQWSQGGVKRTVCACELAH